MARRFAITVCSGVAGEMNSVPSKQLLDALDGDEAVIYVLDPDFRIIHCNPAWDRFALNNAGRGVTFQDVRGKLLFDLISEPLRGFYAPRFRAVRRTGEQWEHLYECSTPDEYRIFRQRVLTMEGGGMVVVMNILETQHPHGSDRPICPPDVALYADYHGFIAMCSNCRRTRRTRHPVTWDWVPEYLKGRPHQVTHSLCPVCAEHFFGEL